MHRLRELIYPTYFLQLISIIAQKSQIPRECRAVAAYVDDTFWLHLEDGLEQHFIAAFAWRVDYDHVCVDTVFLVFSRQDFFCFSDEEFHVFNIVDLCISFCIIDRCRDDFYASDEFGLLSEEKGDRSDSAVQIPDGLFSMKVCIFQCLRIQFPGLFRVYLEERKR